MRGGRAGYGAGSSFFHGFQLTFTFKTVFKALDNDLHFVQCCCIAVSTVPVPAPQFKRYSAGKSI